MRSTLIRMAVGTTLAIVVLAVTGVAAAGAKTIWLCRPGQHPDPCTPGLSTTYYSPQLKPLGVAHPKPVAHPKIDCFYVYPTVSDQTTVFSNRHVDPEERSIALYQAARYSQYCRVFAPMYRQVTVPALETGTQETPRELRLPLSDVRQAFATYLKHDSHGRGFVLIGHSQGSFLLRELIAKVIDGNAALRHRLVSAIVLGGNVLVRRGRTVGGDFKHVPACETATQLGCVIAYSSFDGVPPANSLFGRATKTPLGGTTIPGEQVLCVNPARLVGSSTLEPIFPSAPFAPGTLIAEGTALLHLTQPMPPTVWSAEPGAYSARCETVNGARVLELTALHGAQVPTPSPNAMWGLHLLDANIELGDLLTLVRREAAAYTGG
jgi:Protein of unknown function (DUF3089)